MDQKAKKQDQPEDVNLEDRVKALEQEVESLTDQLKRAIADYRNLERRNSEEKSEDIKFANRSLIESLLPAFDTLILAGKYTEDQNVKLTIVRILEILKDNGIEKVETNGAKYNADTMEAIEIVEGEEGMVVEELRPGFILKGKLIRPSQVKVGGKKNTVN